MTHDHHGHHAHPDAHGPASPETVAELADLLELDAAVFAGQLAEIAGWVAEHGMEEPHRIADLGAGAGAWTRALARRFPCTDVLAVDRSEQMLARVRGAADEEGWGAHVRAVEADLNAGWPAPADLDLVWAASLLHELPDPGALLRQTHTALRAGGLLAVVEMVGLPGFLPEPDLEARCHAALREAGWNHYPDWTPHLADAGFELLERRTFTAAPATRRAAAGALARGYLRRIRAGLEGRVSAADLRSLDAVLAADGPASLEHRHDLAPRAARTVWLARRP